METPLANLKQNGAADGVNQYLTFSLDGEEYGVDILKVQEIKGFVPTTRLPNSPDHVTGVLNLRGAIVPLIDLRKKFGIQSLDYDKFNAIIVLYVGGQVMGMIVDSVSEVITLTSDSIQPAPDVPGVIDAQLVTGMASVNDKLIILLDVDAVFSDETHLTAAVA